MTAALFGTLANVAQNLLTQFGLDVTIKRVEETGYNMTTGAVTDTVTNYTVKGQIFDYSAYQISSSGGLILSGDRKVTIAGKGLPWFPAAQDIVTIQGRDWRIIRVTSPVQLAPAEQIVYDLQVRLANG